MNLRYTKTTIRWVRPGAADAGLVLTPSGRGKVRVLARNLTHFPLDLVVCSSAPQVTEMARLILESFEKPVEVIALGELHEPSHAGMQALVREACQELNYAALRAYLEHRHADAIQSYFQGAAEQVEEALQARFGSDIRNKNILVIADGVLLNGMIHHLFTETSVRDYVLYNELGQCGRYDVTFGLEPGDVIICRREIRK